MVANLREGDAFSLQPATEVSWSGRVEFVLPPRGFCLRVTELNQALVWLTIEGAPEKYEVQSWLSAYNVPRERVALKG